MEGDTATADSLSALDARFPETFETLGDLRNHAWSHYRVNLDELTHRLREDARVQLHLSLIHI